MRQNGLKREGWLADVDVGNGRGVDGIRIAIEKAGTDCSCNERARINN